MKALALLIVLSLGTACGGKTGTGAVEYSVSAQKNYEKGLAQLDAKDWVAASKYFGFIKSRFPYSKYAVLAELPERVLAAPPPDGRDIVTLLQGHGLPWLQEPGPGPCLLPILSDSRQ
mgnify:CR=1 FL=1